MRNAVNDLDLTNGLSKGETLLRLREQGYNVPATLCFSVKEWRDEQDEVIDRVKRFFLERQDAPQRVAVRSSSRSEDTAESSQAGAFQSVLGVDVQDSQALSSAIETVAGSLDGPNDQIIVQPMVVGVVMAGVAMTRHLDDGSPYYVVNYDDTSGRTDTVTSGTGAHKTVFIYRGVRDEYFDSPRLRLVVDLAHRLEETYRGKPLDIEFAIDGKLAVHLLQVRPIAASRNWPAGIAEEIDRRIGFVEAFVRQVMAPRDGLYGSRTILGVMPDWNPAEMIGISPRPLALSLYRQLITRRTWSMARERMGYRALPPVELMLAVGGRPYIDVRASFNSFLPEGLPENVSERLVNAWLDRLDDNPSFHDKVEFEIVHTVNEPDMEKTFRARYGDLLSADEFLVYRRALTGLTNRALLPTGMLPQALDAVAGLEAAQLRERGVWSAARNTPFDLAQRIGLLLEQCLLQGTLPFAVIARHGFIVESFFRAAVREGALPPERVSLFKRGVRTVSGRLSGDFSRVLSGRMAREDFLMLYGHLRPGTYDILSASYSEREDLFDAAAPAARDGTEDAFEFTPAESRALAALFRSAGIKIDPEPFLAYAKQAIAGREYGKFVFSRHVSGILDLLIEWGKHYSLSREDLSMLPVGEILNALFAPQRIDGAAHFRQLIQASREEYQLMRSFKMAYLLRSIRDIYIVPQHRSAPNFITAIRLQARTALLDDAAEVPPDLAGRIVCIESADPGYDWIFTRGIAGLVTRYGGANSHMAIRCAEWGLPAAIGCGDLLFEQIAVADTCLLDCAGKALLPLREGGKL